MPENLDENKEWHWRIAKILEKYK